MCKTNTTINFPTIKQRLDDYYETKDGEHYPLKTMVKLNPEVIISDDEKYISGKLYYQKEIEIIDFDITDDKKLHEDKFIRRSTFIVDFYMCPHLNIILFKNSKDYVHYGKQVLSSLLYGDNYAIKSLNFNIEDLEKEVLNGKFHGMWTLNFRDRSGNITSGTNYGDNVNMDPMYGQMGGAPRNFIGIEKEFEDNTVKIRICRKGSVTFMANMEEDTHMPKVFYFLNQILKFHYIQD